MIHKIKDIIYILKNSNLIVRATFIALVILVLGYIKATCFAYTWEDINFWLIETNNNIQLNQQPQTQYLDAFNNIYDRLITKGFFNATTQNIDISNKYVVFYSDSLNWWHIYVMTQEPTITINSNNRLNFSNYGTCIDYRFNNNNGTLIKDQFTNNINNNNGLSNRYTLFFNTNNINNDWNKVNADNLYTWNESIYKQDTQIIGESILVNDNQFYTQFRNGYTWSITSSGFDFKLYYLLNESKIYLDNYTNKNFINTGENAYIVIYDYDEKIPLNTPLYNELYYNNRLVSTSPYFMLDKKQVTPSGDSSGTDTSGLGDITTPSGDSGGNIDLTPIVNSIDSNTQAINRNGDKIVQAIESGNNKIIQAIESGEEKAEERHNFWKETYERLVQPSGEIIKNELMTFYNELSLNDSGEISGEIENVMARTRYIK